MTTYSQNNFLINHQYQDFFSDIQRNTERIGEVGKVSDDYKKRAYDQFQNHDFNSLAKTQDSFIAPDKIDGTRGRDKNRNYKRMEYDTPERHDGKEHYMNAYGKVRKLTGWQRIKDRWRGFTMGLKSGTIDNFSDHSMVNYIANLEAHVKEN